MRVLVTRPFEDAHETAALLAERGHTALIAPLLDIRFLGGALTLEGVQAVVATSSNGVRAVARRTARRDLPLFAVGEKTGDVARGFGFANVTVGPGDASSLARSIPAWARPELGELFWAAGETDTGTLETGLAAMGYRVRREVLYAATPVPRLPGNARDALANNSLDAVLLFSPRSAEIFSSRVREESLTARLRQLRICCISDAAAAASGLSEIASVRIAARPDQESVLDLLT